MHSIGDHDEGSVELLLRFESAPVTWDRGDYKVSTDRKLLNISVIQRFLIQESAWGADLTPQMIVVAINNSLSFGLYHERDNMIGFARVVTDGAMFAYVRDVFVLSAYRGRGLARWLMECVCGHPDIMSVRTWLLSTFDAHGLYERCGFHRSERPEKYMERKGVKVP